MELSNALLGYLTMPSAQQAVLIPGAMTLFAFWHLDEKDRLPLFKLFVLSTIISFMTARWDVTDDVRSLFILPCALFGVGVFLWQRIPISAPGAFAITFLSLWAVDMVKASELVAEGEASWQLFYYGVGGAGWRDGLAIFPVLSAALVHYGRWRAPKPKITSTCPLAQLA